MYLEGLISEGLIQSEICVLKKYSAKTYLSFFFCYLDEYFVCDQIKLLTKSECQMAHTPSLQPMQYVKQKILILYFDGNRKKRNTSNIL